jgi:hypothetical protein
MSEKFKFMTDTAAVATKPLTQEQYLELLRVVEESMEKPIITPRYDNYMDTIVLLECGTKENAEKVFKALQEGLK